MTEQELIDLRDSLVGFDTVLSALDVRVTAVEDAALPKGQYFEQLVASFQDSPECCNCGTEEITCNCEGALYEILLKGDGDSGFFNSPVTVTINNVAYTSGGSAATEDIRDIVPSELILMQMGSVYLYDVANEYIETAWYLKVLNMTSGSLCVRITTTQDQDPAYPMEVLSIPTVVDSTTVYPRTDFPYENGEDFIYVANPSAVQGVSDSNSSTITFCLAAAVP